MGERSLSNGLNLLQRDLKATYHSVGRVLTRTVRNTPAEFISTRVNGFVQNHRNVLFGCSMILPILLCPVGFAAGVVVGVGATLAHNIGLTDFKPHVVSTKEGRGRFVYFSLFTLLLTPPVSGFIHGFTLANHVFTPLNEG